MLVSAVVAGLAAGLVLKGRITRLATLQVQWLPLFGVAVGLHLAALLPLGLQPQRDLYMVSLWLLVVVAARNLVLFATPLVTAGLGLNAIGVTAAGGAMPVSPDAIAASHTLAPTDPLHAITGEPGPLGDVIPLPFVGVYSIGDIVLASGVFLLIVGVMRDRQ